MLKNNYEDNHFLTTLDWMEKKVSRCEYQDARHGCDKPSLRPTPPPRGGREGLLVSLHLPQHLFHLLFGGVQFFLAQFNQARHTFHFFGEVVHVEFFLFNFAKDEFNFGHGFVVTDGFFGHDGMSLALMAQMNTLFV